METPVRNVCQDEYERLYEKRAAALAAMPSNQSFVPDMSDVKASSVDEDGYPWNGGFEYDHYPDGN